MAEITGYFLEQKVETVTNDDATINAAITTAAAESPEWVVTTITVSGSNVIILFTRQRVVV